MKTDWFELNEARLHLRPTPMPHFPIAVACATTPSGVLAAGKYGVGAAVARRRPARRPAKLADSWRQGEAEAAKHGKTFKRDDWRLVVNMHCAEEDERAFRDVARRRADRDADLFLRNPRAARRCAARTRWPRA